MPTSVPTHHSPPVPTIRLQHPPLKSSIICYQSRIRREIVVFDGSSNHHRVSLGSDAHHSAATPITRLRRQPFASGTHHSATTPTTQIRHPIFISGTHHSAPMPTTRLRHPPVDSSTDYLPPVLTTQLQQHSQSERYSTVKIVVFVGFREHHWDPLGSDTHHLDQIPTTWL